MLAKLPDNWNGNGAESIPLSLISKMRGLVLTLSHQPDIFPTACNSIQFEYEKEDGSYLEFELFEEQLKLFAIDRVGAESTRLLTFDAQEINKVVDNFYGC